MTFPRRADQWTKADSVSESYCLPSQLSQMPVVSAELGFSFCLSAKKCDCYFTSDTLKSTGRTIPFLREDKCSRICLWFLVIKKIAHGIWMCLLKAYLHTCALLHAYRSWKTQCGLLYHAPSCSMSILFARDRVSYWAWSLPGWLRGLNAPFVFCLLHPCLVLQELLDAARLYVGSGTLNAGLHLTQQALLPTNRLPGTAYLLHCEIFRTLLT